LKKNNSLFRLNLIIIIINTSNGEMAELVESTGLESPRIEYALWIELHTIKDIAYLFTS